MPLRSTEEIESSIVELCSEDDYGSWELWWNISADVPNDQKADLKSRFVNVVKDLVLDGKLIAKTHTADGKIAPTQFDREKLADEVDSARDPNPDSFFWFGTQ
jgi:hypothetical protein